MSQTLTTEPPAIELRRLPSRSSHDADSDTTAPASLPPPQGPQLTSLPTLVSIFAISFSTILSTLVSGMFTVTLPSIARDVALPRPLLLWPQSINSLVSACTLLICGSLADVLGSKRMYVAGSALQAVFILATGLAQTSAQLLVFRAFTGLAASMFLPSAVSIAFATFPAGPTRNMAFATMGGGQPLGFSVGLVLGGVFTDTLSWRVGMFIAAGLSALVAVVALFGLRETPQTSGKTVAARLREDIDWVGALLVSAALGTFCYFLALITQSVEAVRAPRNIAVLVVSVLLLPVFVAWEHRQAKLLRPALIPNAIWRNRVFTVVCLGVFFSWGAFNATDQLISLWIQLVQGNSALQTSVRLLPEAISGLVVNVLIGLFVHRLPTNWIITGTMLLTLLAPILMAVSQTQWIYWAACFPAIVLIVVGPDSLYTISNLVISKQFPAEAQGLAGGVFNTMVKVGNAVGLALSGVAANSVTAAEAGDPARALADGYRAGFWLCLGLNGATVLLSAFGLRKMGRIGGKED